MGESKKRINSMLPHITQAGTQGSTKLPEYGICSSYTEYRHYKKSAAKAAVADLKMSGISNAADGLVQAIADNFDADTSSHLPSFSLSTPRPLRGWARRQPKNQKGPQWFLWGSLWCWYPPVPATETATNAWIPCYKGYPHFEVACPPSNCS